MGEGVVPGGPSAVYAIALAILLVLSVVSPVLAADAPGEQGIDDDLLGTDTATSTPTETDTATPTDSSLLDTELLEDDTETATSTPASTETATATKTATATETTTATETATPSPTPTDSGGVLDDATNETSETIEETTNNTTETVDDTTDAVNETVDNTTDVVNETVDNTTDAVNETVTNTSDAVEETVNETTDSVNETVNNTTGSSDELLTGSGSLQQTTVTVENATAGEPLTVDVSAADTGTVGVSRMTIVPERDGEFTLNVTASDEQLSDAPEFTRRDGGVALGNIRVNHTIADENISNVTFTFSLSEERLERANATPDEVALYRYHDGSWNTLETEFLYETDGSYVFRANSPGLSDFTAAAQKPEFELTKAVVDPTNVSVGDGVDIRVRIDNVGDADGSYTAKLLFDDEVVETRQVTIAADGTRQVSFARAPEEAGTYEVEVNNESAGTLFVEPTGTATATDTTSGITTKTAPGFGPLGTVAALAALFLFRRR